MKRLPAGLILFAISPVAMSEGAGHVMLAQNDEVIQAWQQAGGMATELSRREGGGTVIQWKGGATLDAYHNNVSGGSTVTPYGTGDFHKLQLQSDLRVAQPNGELTYLQFSATNTDDRSVLSHAPGTQIDALQFGYSATDYLLALGDVTADFSSLGSSAGLRGMLVQKQLGDVLFSGIAGVQAESWEQLSKRVDRTQFLRYVYGAKVDSQVGKHTRLFVTAQSYEDDEDSASADATVLAAASAYTTTAGFAYQQDRFSLQGEAGFSHWQESGRDAENDRAFILDTSWSLGTLGLTAGHHDIGRYYSSLSAQAGSGLRETYLNINWLATDEVNLNMDLRHSVNEQVAASVTGTPPANTSVNSAKTDALSSIANITFGPEYVGWSLMLSQSLSRGENTDGTGNRNTGYGSTLSFVDERWNASLGYQFASSHNGGAPSTDSDSRTWQFSLGRNWSNATEMTPATWLFGLSLGYSRQQQKLDIGGGPTTDSWQLNLNGQNSNWGTLSAAYMRGTTSGQPGGGDLHQESWQIDASYPLGHDNSVNFYLRHNGNTGSVTGADYEEDTAGIQLVWTI